MKKGAKFHIGKRGENTNEKKLKFTLLRKGKARKPGKQKKPGKKISIGTKINILTFSIIAVMSVMLAILSVQSRNYSEEYAGVLENISKITFIKSNLPKYANTMINLCNLGGNIAESGYKENIELVNQYVEDIESNIGDNTKYNQNKRQLTPVRSSVEKYTQSFNDLCAACGENFSPKGAEMAKKMSDEASFLNINAETLLTYEITRSEDVQKEIQANFAKMLRTIIMLVLVVVILAVIIAIRVSHGITRPMKELQKRMASLAQGDLTIENIVVRTNDETGDLANAFNQMKENLTQIISKVSKGTIEMQTATATVDVSIGENAKGSMRISEAIEAMLLRLEEQTAETKKIMDQVTQMGAISDEVSKSAEHIQKNSDDSLNNAGVGAENIRAYVAQMAEVNTTMNAMAEVFKTFSESTKQMNRVLATISEIAEQTNLLSLNASIEAARAGEAGRGFAVVATEIRKLADDSQNAAKEIGGMINAVQKDAESMSGKLKESLVQLDKGNQLAEETSGSFDLIKDGTELVNTDVQDIMSKIQRLADVMAETIDGVQLIHNAADSNVMEINDISAIVTEEAANQEEVSATTTMLANLSTDLEEVVSGFKLAEESEAENEEETEDQESVAEASVEEETVEPAEVTESEDKGTEEEE